MTSATILIVDDEETVRTLLRAYLLAEGYTVHTAADGPEALLAAHATAPDLVVLDVMLPGLDGFEVCRRIQQERNCYVLMLTARDDEIDKLVGLSVGADDYLTKPFSPRELVARVKAILRRNRMLPQPETQAALRFQGLEIDPERREVRVAQTLVDLTVREFDLLHTLAATPGRVFRREHLLDAVWGHEFAGVDRVVDVHIGLLRRKLNDDPNDPALIVTVRGIGYKFVGQPL